jgi:hypothetical protein
MTRFTKIAFAAALVAGSASAALAEDSSSSFDKALGNGQAGYAYSAGQRGMTSRSVSLQNTRTGRKAMNRASQERDGGGE